MNRNQDDGRGRRRGRKLSLLEGAVFACLALGVRAATASDASGAQILIQNFRFDPPTLSVPVGATVTWTNHDEEIHTLVSPQGGFSSPALDSDQQFAFRFEKPGTYQYRCGLHPQMTGTVVVR
jgi:plastocyanin